MQKTALMTGNEAIARGAFEGGVTVGTAYPGTPSTEIMEVLARNDGVHCGWSPNEKVALEVGAGASFEGARVLVAMKHVGLNVAADPLMTLSYTGVGGGLVLISAGDPGMHSSQNEQDNRYYARLAKIPLLEPADSQEAKDYVLAALALSEKFDTPVMLGITTRVAHSRSIVKYGKRRTVPLTGFRRDSAKLVMLPAFARRRHLLVEQRLEALRAMAESSPLNRIEDGPDDTGIICSGITYQYVREALPGAPILKLGLSYPLPVNLVRNFAARVRRLIVIEELDPLIEEQVRALGIAVEGKSLFPPTGELGTEIIREMMCEQPPRLENGTVTIPDRPPLLCPGCSHRGVFYTLKKLKLQVMGDIGCYTLAALPPLEAIDTCICMGASIGLALGREKANPDTAAYTVAVIGDSTFFHSGITPLIDVVSSGASTTVLILDNCTTAMTGHQDHPGTGKTLQGQTVNRVDLEGLCRAAGVRRVTVVDPYNLDQLRRVITREVKVREPSVVIARRPCVLLKKCTGAPLPVDPEKCNGCGLCLQLGCPALSLSVTGKISVNESICTGCGLCRQLCRHGAFGGEDCQ